MSSPNNYLANIISACPTAIAIVDLDMRYIAASKQWIEDYSLEEEELIGRSHYDLFPEIGAEWKAIHAECLRGKSRKNPRDKFVRLDGTIQWLSWDVRPWMDNKGIIGGMIMSSDDITDRMIGEIELKRSIDLFNETNEAARIGSWEFDVIAGTIYWSQIAKKIHEVDEDFIPEVSGIREFYKDGTDPELIEKMISSAQIDGRSFDEDLEIVTAKGNNQWIRLRGNPHFKDGKCIRVSGTIQDIQELKTQSLLLRDSEEKYKSILKNSLNPHFLIRTDGYILEANKAALDMFGYTIEEMRILKREEVMDTSDPGLAAYLQEREETGSAKAELTGIHKNGERLHLECSSVFFTDSTGVQRTSVSMVDITDRKKTENILREERELLKTLIDNIPASIFIKDLELRKTLVNRAECELMGVKDSSEILGKNNYELFPTEFAKVTTAEDLEVLRTGISTIDEEKDVIWLDGSIKHFLTSKIPLYDKGKISGLLGITHDISKIKEAENALLESERKFRKIFENIQDVFYQTDQAGLVTEISPSIEKHSGYTREEVIGKPVTNFYYNLEDRQELIQTIMTNRMVSDFEVRLKTKAGEKRYSSVNAQLIYKNGEIIGTEGSMRDVTDRKIQEDALRSLNSDLGTLNDQKNKLLSVIAHDLKTPIAGSLALLELVFNDLDSTSREELVEYLGMIQKGVLNAHELLEDLLEWASIQFHSVDFIPALIPDIATDVRQILTKLEPLAQAKEIALIQDIEDGLPLLADKHMLASVIRNLVTNAIKFTNKDGRVVVSAIKQKSGYLFSVADNGVGVPEENVEKLFNDERGFTSYGTFGEKGTGLGLGLCRNFVEKHGGRIWVESVVGAGSTFFFTIPEQEVNQEA